MAITIHNNTVRDTSTGGQRSLTVVLMNHVLMNHVLMQ